MSENFFWNDSNSEDDDYIALSDYIDFWLNNSDNFINRHDQYLVGDVGLDENVIRQIIACRGKMNGAYYEIPRVSPFKKASILVNAIGELRPFHYPSMTKISKRVLRDIQVSYLANFHLAWDIAKYYLVNSNIDDHNGNGYCIGKLPKFPSLHMKSEIIEQHSKNKLTVQSIALILETMTYETNPEIKGIRDDSFDGGDSLYI